MKRSRTFRMLMLTTAMLGVVLSMLWRVPVAGAEPTVTVYKEPT
jgi:hypothetical protein